jgi:hypothetical protein
LIAWDGEAEQKYSESSSAMMAASSLSCEGISADSTSEQDDRSREISVKCSVFKSTEIKKLYKDYETQDIQE